MDKLGKDSAERGGKPVYPDRSAGYPEIIEGVESRCL